MNIGGEYLAIVKGNVKGWQRAEDQCRDEVGEEEEQQQQQQQLKKKK
jgi:hypothetical protein